MEEKLLIDGDRPPEESASNTLIWVTSKGAIDLIDYSYAELQRHSNDIIIKFGEEKYQELLSSVLWNTKDLLDFSDFVLFPHMNNIKIFFFSNYMGIIYRGRPIYIRFESEYPELASSLRENYGWGHIGKNESDGLNDSISYLYNAYKIMLSYEEVLSNWELFQ